jgi:hypothetical protein
MKLWHTIIALSAVAGAAAWWTQRGEREELAQLRGTVQAASQTASNSQRDADRALAYSAAAQRRAAAAAGDPRGDGDPATDSAASHDSVTGAPAAPDGDDNGDDRRNGDAAPARPRIDPATLRDHLTAAFDTQPDDAAWSAPARRMIETKLAAAVPHGSALRSIECRTTLCRIEMQYDDVAQYQAFLRKLTPDALPWNGTFFATAAGDPSERPARFVAFLSREGQELAVQ